MLKRFSKFLMLTFALSVGAIAHAEGKPDTPTTLKGGRVVSAAEVKTLLEARNASVFDTRKALNFGKGHLPGAVLVSYNEKSEYAASFDSSVDSFELSKLPADKNARIVIYSDGRKGWKSYKASVVAIKNGYKGVHWFRGGYAEWTAQGAAAK